MNFYFEQLELIATVTKMLNENVPKFPDFEDTRFNISVELKDEDGKVLGYWSPEIADDCWSFFIKEPVRG